MSMYSVLLFYVFYSQALMCFTIISFGTSCFYNFTGYNNIRNEIQSIALLPTQSSKYGPETVPILGLWPSDFKLS